MERFWSKVEKTEGCWNWLASKDRSGYGYYSVGGKTIKAHRAAWILSYGDIPDAYGWHGICVLHKCDNPSCVRPDHLFLGSVTDNNKDRARKQRNRNQSGTNHNKAKLSETDVLAIREEFRSGKFTYSDLAEKYGVHKMHIGAIIRKVYWSHI